MAINGMLNVEVGLFILFVFMMFTKNSLTTKPKKIVDNRGTEMEVIGNYCPRCKYVFNLADKAKDGSSGSSRTAFSILPKNRLF